MGEDGGLLFLVQELLTGIIKASLKVYASALIVISEVAPKSPL